MVHLHLMVPKTILDREFKFTVRAEDRFGYSAIDREFTIPHVLDPR